ncbi:MAG: hypothetical protein CSYNP_01593 [Syntrophus sp. SKADARSKE-3]|nr:hypothetical protein [Syntrophus sp. SKADARSKE-3]
MGKWIEVFKTGTHTSGNGITKTYTEADLDRIVTKYNGQSEKAPLVIGHPKVDDPAYGWIGKLQRVGRVMMAYVEDINEKIIEAVAKGMFRKVSIALYADDLLRHVGLLGATPPAVKGLAPVEFAADKDFQEYSVKTTTSDEDSFLGELKAFFTEMFAKHKSQEKNNQEDQMDTKEIQTLLDAQAASLAKTFADTLAPVLTKVAAIETDITGVKTAMAEQKTAFDKQLQEQKFADAKATFATFCDGLIAEGKVLAAERDGLIDEYADLITAETVMTFAEGQKPLTVKFKDRLAARVAVKPAIRTFATREKAKTDTNTPGAVDIPSEFAGVANRVDETSIDIDAEITAYAEKHNVSYEIAATAYAAGK